MAVIASSVMATDTAAASSFNWTGAYAGGTIGGALGRSSYTGTPTGDYLTPEPI